MTKSNKPDNARDLDADLDIPTYDPTKPAGRTSYDRKNSAASETSKQARSTGAARRVERPDDGDKKVTDSRAGNYPRTEVMRPAKTVESRAELRDDASVSERKNSEERLSSAAEDPAPKPKRSRVFDRAGHAEPQTIAPRQAAPDQVAAAGRADAAEELGASAEAATTAFPQAGDSNGAEETTVLDRTGRRSPASSNAETEFIDAPVRSGASTGAGIAAEDGNRGGGRVDDAYPDDAYPAHTYPVEERAEGDYPADDAGAGAEPAPADPALGDTQDSSAEHRRGTMDFGLLLVRLALGFYFICTAVATFFNVGGSGGLSELEADFSAYPRPEMWAIAIPALQLFAGVFLVLGLVAPFAAMVAVAVTGFSAIHNVAVSGVGFDVFSWSATEWLPVLLFLISLAVQFTGPGTIAADFSRSWARRPLTSSWIFAVLGIAVAIAAAFVAGIF